MSILAQYAGRYAKWKIWTAAGVGLLVLADLVLGVVLWQTNREAPEEMAARRTQLQNTAKLLASDVARGDKIRASFPEVRKQSDDFYQHSFLDGRTAYSSVFTDLAAIAAKAGVKTSGLKFDRKDIKERSVSELKISTSVDGDYAALLQFVNGLQRSKVFYLLDQLQLASSGPGGIKLQIVLHTYFRT